MTRTRRELLQAGIGAVAGGFARATGCRTAAPRERAPLPEVCVIGSGFAGAHLSLRMLSLGHSVVLLEAGGVDVPPAVLEQRFRCEVSGNTPYPVQASRLIGPGGSSGHWSGILSRMWPDDFRMRSLYGIGADWPIDAAAVEGYLCEAQELLAGSGPPEAAAAEPPRSCPYPDETEGPGDAPSLNGGRWAFYQLARSRRFGAPVRLQDEEIPRLRRAKGALFLEGMQALRLHSENGRTIDAVVCIDAHGRLHRVRAQRFVVAAGAFESPRLLLQSKSRWHPEGLGNRGRHLGRNFSVHPAYRSHFASAALRRFRGRSYRSNSDEARLRRAGLDAIAWQVNVRADDVMLVAQTEVVGTPGNRLTVGQADEHGMSIPLVHLDLGDRDRRTLAQARGTIDALSDELADPGGDHRQEQRFRMHPAGMCRMANRAADGVVDADLKVFGVDNLYVSGACVFPTAGTCNPTLTVVALSLRLADHLHTLARQ